MKSFHKKFDESSHIILESLDLSTIPPHEWDELAKTAERRKKVNGERKEKGSWRRSLRSLLS